MRFRISKHHETQVYTIMVRGEMNDDGGWDILQIAQTILHLPNCQTLVIDLCDTLIDEEVTVLNLDILVSVFEEAVSIQDTTLIVRYRHDREIRLTADALTLGPRMPYYNVPLGEAKLCSRAMQWLGQEASLLVHGPVRRLRAIQCA